MSFFLPDVSTAPVSAPRRSSSAPPSVRVGQQLLAIHAAGEVGAHEAVVVVAVVRVEHEEARARVELLRNSDGVLGAEEVVRARRHRVVAGRPHDLVRRPARTARCSRCNPGRWDWPLASRCCSPPTQRPPTRSGRRQPAPRSTSATSRLWRRRIEWSVTSKPARAQAHDDGDVEHEQRRDGDDRVEQRPGQ